MLTLSKTSLNIAKTKLWRPSVIALIVFENYFPPWGIGLMSVNVNLNVNVNVNTCGDSSNKTRFVA